jgi:hypothetical protein
MDLATGMKLGGTPDRWETSAAKPAKCIEWRTAGTHELREENDGSRPHLSIKEEGSIWINDNTKLR